MKKVEDIIVQSAPKKATFFIFGSALTKSHFGDIDIGAGGKITDAEINVIKDKFENSNLPYFVDVINFNDVSDSFKRNIMHNNKVLWIKR
ncbi:MAG: nucleotidyltransferase domain-containing protein [bacterium]|nr:nucleotidyltransferase domain-containing protein [bacterium]